jgi:cell division protein FtsB
MKLSSREKLLVLLLPLVAVLGSYAWWFNMVQRPRLAKLQKDYAAAVAGAVQPMTVLEQRAELAKTQREVAALEQRRSDLQRQAHELSCSYLDPQQRHRVEEQLTAVFRRHRLRLIEEAPAGKGEAGKLPKTLTDAVSRRGTVGHQQMRCPAWDRRRPAAPNTFGPSNCPAASSICCTPSET